MPKKSKEDIIQELIEAAQERTTRTVKSVLKRYRNSLGDDHLMIALISAVNGGHVEVVRALLDAGLRIKSVHEITESDKDSPLVQAAERGYANIFSCLLKTYADNGRLDPEDTHGGRALLRAAKNGHTWIVQELIVAGVDPERDHAVGEDGRTALMHAAKHGRILMVRCLLAKGLGLAHINRVDHDGNTALIYASADGHTEVVQALLDQGLGLNDLNVVDRKGNTALIYAARHGYIDIVRVLLGVGLGPDQINVAGHDGNTALSWSLARKYTDIAMLLLARTGQSPKSVGLDREQVQSCDMLQLSGSIMALDMQWLTPIQIRQLRARVENGHCSMVSTAWGEESVGAAHAHILHVCRGVKAFKSFFKKYDKRCRRAQRSEGASWEKSSAAEILFELSYWVHCVKRKGFLGRGASKAYKAWHALTSCRMHQIRRLNGDHALCILPPAEMARLEGLTSFTWADIAKRGFFPKGPLRLMMVDQLRGALESLMGQEGKDVVVNLTGKTLVYGPKGQAFGPAVNVRDDVASTVEALGGSGAVRVAEAVVQGAPAAKHKSNPRHAPLVNRPSTSVSLTV